MSYSILMRIENALERLDVIQSKDHLLLLLVGGDKSTQARDLARAIRLA